MKIILMFMLSYLEHCVLLNTSVIGDIKQLTQTLSCQAALLMHLKCIRRNQQLSLCSLMPKYNIHPQYCFHVLQVYIMNYQGCLYKERSKIFSLREHLIIIM